MSFVSHKCLKGRRRGTGKRSIFTTKSLKDIVYLLHSQHDVEGYNPDRIGYLLGQFEGNYIFRGRHRTVRPNFANNDVIVRIRADGTDDIFADEYLSYSGDDMYYELRFVCATSVADNGHWVAKAYCRHGENFSGWWLQERGDEPTHVHSE